MGVRMRLEEKRRQMEMEKRNMEIANSHLQQQVGKAAFLHAINKVVYDFDLRVYCWVLFVPCPSLFNIVNLPIPLTHSVPCLLYAVYLSQIPDSEKSDWAMDVPIFFSPFSKYIADSTT